MEKVIYCIRHGQTDYNKNGIVQGSGVDSDLNEMGLIQAKQFYHYYRNKIEYDLIIHSALKRTQQTVSPWLDHGIPSLADARINEISWGTAEGQRGTMDSVALYKTIVDEWSNGNLDIGIPQGETALDLRDRLISFVTDLNQRPEQTILICSHGRAMRGLLCVMQNLPLSKMEEYSVSNVGLYKLKHHMDGYKIIHHNDTSHRTPITHF